MVSPPRASWRELRLVPVHPRVPRPRSSWWETRCGHSVKKRFPFLWTVPCNWCRRQASRKDRLRFWQPMPSRERIRQGICWVGCLKGDMRSVPICRRCPTGWQRWSRVCLRQSGTQPCPSSNRPCLWENWQTPCSRKRLESSSPPAQHREAARTACWFEMAWRCPLPCGKHSVRWVRPVPLPSRF